jgi:hypothetical protein
LSVSLHDLQAPKENGAILAYPPLAEVHQVWRANSSLLGGLDFEILGRPIQSLRSLCRQQVLDSACRYLNQPLLPRNADTPLLMAGHQPELFHPGVWIKNFALSGLAKKHGALAVNLIIDSDTSRNNAIHFPAGATLHAVPYDRWQSETPFEERHVGDESLFRALPHEAAKYMHDWNWRPLLAEFWEEACRQGNGSLLLGECFAAARRAFENRWGCSHLEIPQSLVCQTQGFAWFGCHLLENLPRFWEIYNDTVHAYRKRYGLRSRHHPVPDLDRDGDWLEAPLWAWRAGKNRRGRLMVRRTTRGLELRVTGEDWPTLHSSAGSDELVAQWLGLEAAGHKIRTRALTTTLFARLFVGDLFLHGLGGGKYDELTDDLMRRFYGIEPPTFLVLTGTLLLPFQTMTVRMEDQLQFSKMGRDLRWNPQRHLKDLAGQAGELRKQKMAWIDQTPMDRVGKRHRFETLRRLTDELRPFIHDQEEKNRLNLDKTAQYVRMQQLQSRRDYAFCLYPEEALKPFCEQFL